MNIQRIENETKNKLRYIKVDVEEISKRIKLKQVENARLLTHQRQILLNMFRNRLR